MFFASTTEKQHLSNKSLGQLLVSLSGGGSRRFADVPRGAVSVYFARVLEGARLASHSVSYLRERISVLFRVYMVSGLALAGTLYGLGSGFHLLEEALALLPLNEEDEF